MATERPFVCPLWPELQRFCPKNTIPFFVLSRRLIQSIQIRIESKENKIKEKKSEKIENIDTKQKGKRVRQIIESVQKGLGFAVSE